MRLFKFLFVFILVFSSPSLAQTMPKSGFAHETNKDYTPDPLVKYGTLPNGLRYAVQNWKRPEKNVSIRFLVRAGSFIEKDDELGLMHFLEHMAFNGSENFKEGTLIPLLEKEGLSFGADTNAYTSYMETNYKLDMPKAEKLDLGLKILSDIAYKLTISQGAIDREKGIIEAEWRTRQGPVNAFAEEMLQHYYNGLRFKDRSPIGKPEITNKATKEKLENLYKSYYTPDRSFVVIVGDIDTQKAEALLMEYFGKWEGKNKNPEPNVGKLIPPPANVKFYNDPQLPNLISIAKFKDYIEKPETKEEKLKALNFSLANSIFNQRMAKAAKLPETPFLFATLAKESNSLSIEGASLTILLKNDKDHDKALKFIENEVRKVIQFGFTEQEHKYLLDELALARKNAFDNEANRYSSSIADAIMASLNGHKVYVNSKTAYEEVEKFLPQITKENAQKAFIEAWGNEKPAFYIVSPNKLEIKGENIETAWNEAQKQVLKADIERVLKPWNYTNFGNSPVSFTKKYDKEIDTSFYKFANNVHFVFKKTNFQKGKININVNFGEGNLSFPADKRDLIKIAETSFISGGLNDYDDNDLDLLMAGKQVGASFNSTAEKFVLSASTIKSDFKLQMQYLAAYMTQVKWRDNGYKSMMNSVDMIYNMKDISAGSVHSQHFDFDISNNDIRDRFISADEMKALRLDDAKNIVNKALQNTPVEIVIVGDIDEAMALEEVKNTFAKMPKRPLKLNPYVSERQKTFTKTKSEKTYYHKGSDKTSMLSYTIPMPSFGDGIDARKLYVLELILNNKLTDVIREEKGGDYTPYITSSNSKIHKNFGYLSIRISPNPDEIDSLKTTIEDIIQKLAKGEITQEMLDRANKPNLVDIKEQMKRNSYWSVNLSYTSFYPEEIKFIKNRNSAYSKITLDDVKNVAKKYYKLENAQIIKVLPQSAPAK